MKTPDTQVSRRPVNAKTAVHRGEMMASTEKARQDLKRMDPGLSGDLGVAKVVNINYEEFFVTLRTLSGTSEMFERVPVPLTFPGAGVRHFLGAMPEIGDYCIVGWMSQESGKTTTKSPVILAWTVPGVWPGRDWMTTADFEVDECDMDDPKTRTLTEGAYTRVRHKLRHLHPGGILASSSQGADLVLDEGVLLSNRRGNEFRLRDQDQAAVVRALQEFHALAGARTYAGMVQRDALTLPVMMVSDGQIWDGPLQGTAGVPLDDGLLPPDPKQPEGFLSPAIILQRKRLSASKGNLSRSYLGNDPYLDPYTFLRWGGLIDERGFVTDPRVVPTATYGGKPLFRVASLSTENAVLSPEAATLTEYRVEVCHTSDGTLPVTEQTDMFDADRLPKQDQGTTPLGLPTNAPFIEWVMGSVVGNDPFSPEGKKKYALPLRAVVFDGDQPSPRLEPANIQSAKSAVEPTPLKEHAATLFRLTSPFPTDAAETWWSVNKQGQLKASIGGPVKENSIEIYLAGGLKLGVGGEFKLLMDGHLELGSRSKGSVSITAPDGPVKIYGGGPLRDAETMSTRLSGTGRGETDLPAVDIEAKTNARIRAGKQVLVKAAEAVVDATSVRITGHEDVSVDGVHKLSMSTEQMTITVNGQRQESFGGPQYLLPTNFPLHERTYVPFMPGFTCEKVTYVMGDREEKFNLGNHSTSILIGNMTYKTLLGFWKAQALVNTLELSPTGLSGTALLGTVSLSAVAGTASMTGLAGVTVAATAGTAVLRGSLGVFLSGPIYGPDAGPILCAGSLEPFTNLPFGTWGIGAKGHLVTP